MNQEQQTNMLLEAGMLAGMLFRHSPEAWAELEREMSKVPDFRYKNHLKLFAWLSAELAKPEIMKEQA